MYIIVNKGEQDIQISDSKIFKQFQSRRKNEKILIENKREVKQAEHEMMQLIKNGILMVHIIKRLSTNYIHMLG